MSVIANEELFEAYLSIKNKYVHDEKSFRGFYLYLADFNQKVRVDMNEIMNTNDLKKALYEGIVLFQFQKIDGTLRAARGTTCPDLVPIPDTPKGVRTPEQQAAYNRQTVTFYDIDKKGWRSMRIDTIWNYHRALKLS